MFSHAKSNFESFIEFLRFLLSSWGFAFLLGFLVSYVSCTEIMFDVLRDFDSAFICTAINKATE